MPRSTEGRSRDELLRQFVEDDREPTPEGNVGALVATVANEGFELEVVGLDREARSEVVLDPRQPSELFVAERRAGLPLLREPVLESLFDGQWVGDEVGVGFEGMPHK